TIAPLSRAKVPARSAEDSAPQASTPTALKLPIAPSAKPPQPARPQRAATLDGSWDKKLRSGSVQPDRILDLHGMTLDRAWQAIDRALDQAIARGERTLVLITGHHRPGEPPVQRGKIRAAVHDWLAASRHAA